MLLVWNAQPVWCRGLRLSRKLSRLRQRLCGSQFECSLGSWTDFEDELLSFRKFAGRFASHGSGVAEHMYQLEQLLEGARSWGLEIVALPGRFRAFCT
jgi:hypothetical protein